MHYTNCAKVDIINYIGEFHFGASPADAVEKRLSAMVESGEFETVPGSYTSHESVTSLVLFSQNLRAYLIYSRTCTEPRIIRESVRLARTSPISTSPSGISFEDLTAMLKSRFSGLVSLALNR